MTIGTFGDLYFYVNASAIQTFDKMKWDSKANYQTHDLHLQKGRLELTGFDPDEVSFDMELTAYLGINPNKALSQLDTMLKNGQVCKLVIGTKVIGNSWVVAKIGREFNHVYKDGDLLSVTVSVELTEYV